MPNNSLPLPLLTHSAECTMPLPTINAFDRPTRQIPAARHRRRGPFRIVTRIAAWPHPLRHHSWDVRRVRTVPIDPGRNAVYPGHRLRCHTGCSDDSKCVAVLGYVAGNQRVVCRRVQRFGTYRVGTDGGAPRPATVGLHRSARRGEHHANGTHA